jgi:hypothetical protein
MHRIDSPIDDLTFDVITVLQNKAKALEAYDKYIEDAADDDEAREVFVEMRRQDESHVRVLKEVLARRLDDDLGYSDEDDLDDEDEDLDVDEDDVDDDLDAGAHRGEETSIGPSDLPRRGESTQRR